MKKILFFDVDDTLIHHRGDKSYIPDSAISAIKSLQDKEHIIAIASGRGYVHIKHIMTLLNIKHAVCFNGNMLVVNHRIIDKTPLDPHDMSRLIKSIKRRIFPAIGMDEETVYLKDFFGKVKRKLNSQIKVLEGADDDMFTGKMSKLVSDNIRYYGFMFFEKGFKQQEKYPQLCFKKWGEQGFEVANKDTSKLSGILSLAKHFNIQEDAIYVFGDNYNDIEMLSGIKNSIAMGNAVDAAKEVANYTTAHVGDDGILKACYHLGLID